MSYEREATGPGGRTASSSGEAEWGDGEASWNREATGPYGGTAYSQGNARYDDGYGYANRAVGVTGSAGNAIRYGSTVTALPGGATAVTYGGDSYYYHGGYYYRPAYVNGAWNYTVIRPPIGVTIAELPDGYAIRSINGVTYYVIDDDLYYKRVYVNGRVGYVVVAEP